MRPAWSLPLNNTLTAPPAFAAARGYFPLDGDRLAAYDVAAGTLQWIVTARTGAMPVVGDGLVFLVAPDALEARHEQDGSIAWRLPFAEPLVAPLVWDTGWLVASTASRVAAFRASDGELIWQREPGARIHAAPSFGGDRLYLSLEDARVLALDVADGTVVWEQKLGGPPNELLALDDRLYIGSDDNFLYALRTRDGLIEWRWRTGADVTGVPIVDRDRVYFTSLDNVLRALDRHTGAQRWKRALPIRPTRSLREAGGVLVVSGASARVYAYNVKDGTAAGDATAAGELASAPYVVHAADSAGLPMMVLVGRDIGKGTIVSAVVRSVEPATAPIGPLPNATPVPPPSPPATPTP